MQIDASFHNDSLPVMIEPKKKKSVSFSAVEIISLGDSTVKMLYHWVEQILESLTDSVCSSKMT